MRRLLLNGCKHWLFLGNWRRKATQAAGGSVRFGRLLPQLVRPDNSFKPNPLRESTQFRH